MMVNLYRFINWLSISIYKLAEGLDTDINQDFTIFCSEEEKWPAGQTAELHVEEARKCDKVNVKPKSHKIQQQQKKSC